MIETSKTKRLVAVTLILILLTLVSSLAGLLNTDMYRPFITGDFIPGIVSQDMVSLAVAIGLFFVLRAMRRGSPRCAWIWSGLMAYLFYAYALYAFDRIYTPFYPAYLAIFSLSLFGLGLLYTSLQPEALTLATYARQPRTLFASYLLINAVLFSISWAPRVIQAVHDKVQPVGNTIFVLDFTIFIPLMVVGAVQIWKKTLLGHALTGLLLIKAGILGTSVFIGQLMMPHYGVAAEPWLTVLFGFLGIGGMALSGLFLSRLEVN